MGIYAVRLQLWGTSYGAYPDAHAVLSLLYQKGYRDESARVSGLLPVVDDKIYLPAPTSWLAMADKKLRKLIRKGFLYVPSEFFQRDWPDSLPRYVVVKQHKVPHVSIDRVNSASNLYFEQVWKATLVPENRPVSEFAVIYDAETSPEDFAKYFVGAVLGANKSHGAAVISAGSLTPPPVDFSMSEGVLLSIALPSERAPHFPPHVYEKWVFYVAGSQVRRRSFGVYGAGSVLAEGEYVGGDVDIAKDDRGFTARLFARPLFVRLKGGE